MLDLIIVEIKDIDVRAYGFNAIITKPDSKIEIIIQREAIDKLIQGLIKAKELYTDEYIEKFHQKNGV